MVSKICKNYKMLTKDGYSFRKQQNKKLKFNKGINFLDLFTLNIFIMFKSLSLDSLRKVSKSLKLYVRNLAARLFKM